MQGALLKWISLPVEFNAEFSLQFLSSLKVPCFLYTHHTLHTTHKHTLRAGLCFNPANICHTTDTSLISSLRVLTPPYSYLALRSLTLSALTHYFQNHILPRFLVPSLTKKT